jgi:uncharacterized protein YeaO (DUF488 family)
MQTSNFANWQHQKFPGAIGISRFPGHYNGWKGPEFTPLMPSAQLLKAFKDGEIDWTEYRIAYQFQLGLLNPTGVWNALHEIAGPHEPVLLCVEGAKTLEEKPCHRRLVADWLGRALGEEIPEWSKENGN